MAFYESRVKTRQSLSARLWLITTLAVLLSEVVVFLPNISHERRTWLMGRLEDAALAVSAAHNEQIDPVAQQDLLRLSGIESIRLLGPTGSRVVMGPAISAATEFVDLAHEDVVTSVRRALVALFDDDTKVIQLSGDIPFQQATRIELAFHRHPLTKALRGFTTNYAGVALIVAGVTGGLVYVAVLILLVRPMRRLTRSIAAFRAEPERTIPLSAMEARALPKNEISQARRELAAMQHELRTALWRNARLAAMGTMLAKVAHDLRGILTPALLTAERLQLNPDPKVSKAGETLVQSVDRASDLVRRALEYAREGPPALKLDAVCLAKLVDEVAETMRPVNGTMEVDNRLPPSLFGRADRHQLFRVLINLLRNAADVGARVVWVKAELAGGVIAIEIGDDGPGLPEQVQVNLFRPFASSVRSGGTGLGMAIARDLMLAHGGDIMVLQTGPSGTVFRLTLPAAAVPDDAAAPEAAPIGNDGISGARIAPATSADV